jgi:hypothetical protein
LGRFVNQDPIKDGVNWYAYADGNPINFIDPLGLSAVLADYIVAKNNGTAWITNHEHNTIAVRIGNETRTTTYETIRLASGKSYSVVDSNWLMNNFGLPEHKATHRHGDRFNSADSAALGFALGYNPTSVTRDGYFPDGREWCANIYYRQFDPCPEDDDGWGYTFEQVRAGGRSGTSVRFSPARGRYGELVAQIHTHGAFKPGSGSSNFSHLDLHMPTVNQYLVTPDGLLKRADIISAATYRSRIFRNRNTINNPSVFADSQTIASGLPRDIWYDSNESSFMLWRESLLGR